VNAHASKIADDELYARHPELVDAAGKRRPLTNSAADASYRKEWQLYYKAVDKADKERFGTCDVGGEKQPCAAPKSTGWDQKEVLKILCNPEDKWVIDVLKQPGFKIKRIDRILYVDKKFNLDAGGNPVGDPIEARAFEGGGSNNAARKEINVLSGSSNEEVAATFVHEARHQVQDKTKLKTWKEQEIDAYTVGEEYGIKKGLPPHHPGFRKKDAAGNTVPDPDAIKAFVEKEYPVDPQWVPGDEIDEGVTDVSSGWDCSKVAKP
jgi:hypothetical protein